MALRFALFAGTRSDIIGATAREAEALGYTSFWVNHPGPVDGLAALAQAAGPTRPSPPGIGAIPLHTRGPESIAEGAKAPGLPRDGLLLGVGSPNPGSLARVRAGVAALRAALPARLVVAALGPNMCRLAGEIADGVLFNWLTPQHARQAAEWVRAGAAAAGRPAPRLFGYVRFALGPGAAARVEAEGARYTAIPAYASHFERMGVAPVGTAIAAETPAAIRPALARWDGVIDEVVLRAVPARDDLEDHQALVRAAKPA